MNGGMVERPDLLSLLHEERGATNGPPPRHLAPLVRITWGRVGPVLAAAGRHLRDVQVTEGGVAIDLEPTSDPAALLDRSALAVARHVLRETVSERIQVSPAAATTD